MSLSDQLLKLSNQAKQLETSATAAKEKNEQKIKDRKAELEGSITVARAEIDLNAAAAEDTTRAAWARQKKTVSDSFDTVRANSAERRAARSAGRAERQAGTAEDDALSDIDFALYAIQEAEYSILDAVDLRILADDEAASLK